jgi:hypothetical protein
VFKATPTEAYLWGKLLSQPFGGIKKESVTRKGIQTERVRYWRDGGEIKTCRDDEIEILIEGENLISSLYLYRGRES